jgi:hypothetical protein
MMDTEMTLAELFEMSDAIGDKYLSEQEIITRDIALASARERVELLIDALIDADDSALLND